MTAAAQLTVAPRFCGPAASANGGYFAGLVAGLVDAPVRVRLRRPPPLAVALPAAISADGRITVQHGDELVAEAHPERLSFDVPPAVSRFVADEAALRYHARQMPHLFPHCFVCGPRRSVGDGLRIFAGEVMGRDEPGLVAAPWVPDSSLGLADGKVAAQFMWAALDCPGYFATPAAAAGRMALLAEHAARIERRLRVDEPAVVIGWRLGGEGRRHESGTALFGADGELCASARAVWIEPRTAGQSQRG
ncbi:MAG: hypothetical protein H7A18_13595 [Sinobacteraceae bacterium]|nr:hypothetical protein [Nevskiaceae bacterium]